MYRRNITKVTAVILAAMMTVSLAGCGATNGIETATDAEIASVISPEDEEQETLENTLTSSTFAGGSEDADKVETVYVTSDANGAVNEIIVSDWLKNTDGSSQILDTTTLNDIVNVKGKETYKDNGDGTISWNANGGDIYYQGYSDQELPVSVKVSYTLDGKEVSPEEIAGANGHVTIRFDYENNAVETVDIGGEETEIEVPFAMVSGVMLDTDKFTNVEVTNGKAVSDANRLVVVGMALPGLKESLNLDEARFDELELTDTDVTIPEYVEISADTTDFELGMTLTMASADILNDLGLGQLTDQEAIDDMETDMSLLSDGADKLIDGAGALTNGVMNLKEGTTQLYDGSKQLYDGTVSLTEGVSTLYDGVSAYTDGASQVNDGAGKLAEGAQTLAAGANSAKEGSSQLRTAMETGNIVGGANDLANGASQVAEGASSLANGISQTREGILGAEQKIYEAVAAGAQTTATVKTTLEAQAGNLQAAGGNLGDAGTALGSVQTDLTSAGSSIASAGTDIASAGTSVGTAMAAVNAMDNLTPEQKEALNGYLSAAVTAIQAAGGDVQAAGGSLQNVGGSVQSAGASIQAAGGNVQAVGDALTGLGSAASGTDVSVDFTELNNALDSLVSGSTELANGASQVAGGASSLATGVGQVYGGVVSLDDGLGTLAGGAGELSSGASSLYDGTSTLVSNNASLLGGVNDLKTGAGSLSDGALDLYNGAGELDGGAGRLADGVGQLSDGLVRLDEEGIRKLSGAFDGSLDNFVNRLSAVDKAGREYTSFTGRTGDMTGSVKFIIRTDAVHSDTWH